MRMKLLIVALSTSLTGVPAFALSPAGKTMIAKGNVQAYENQSDVRKLKRRAPIYGVDTVATDANSKAQFRMNDGTLLALKESSKLLISEYKYNEQQGGGSAVMELVEGGLRSVTGAIKSNNGKYELKTPVGSIGIRGTHYEVEIVSGEVFIAVWDGAIDVNVEVGGTDQVVSFGEGEDFSYASINEEGEVTELLEPPANFNSGHSDDPVSEEEEEEPDQSSSSSQNQEQEEEDQGSANQGSDDENSQQSGNSSDDDEDSQQQSSSNSEEDDSGQQSANSSEEDNSGQQSSESSGESGNGQQTSEQQSGNGSGNSDSEQNAGGSGPATTTTGTGTTDGTTSTTPTETTDTSGTDTSLNITTETGPGPGSSNETPTDPGLPTEENPIEEINETQRDSEVLRVIDNSTKVLPEVIAARTGSANYSTLISSNLSGSLNPRNLNMQISVNFDEAFSEGSMTVDDDGGTWDAAFQGVVVDADLELDMTQVTYGVIGQPNSVQVGSGNISAFFANEGDVLNGNFNLSQGSNNVNGSFLLREN